MQKRGYQQEEEKQPTVEDKSKSTTPKSFSYKDFAGEKQKLEGDDMDNKVVVHVTHKNRRALNKPIDEVYDKRVFKLLIDTESIAGEVLYKPKDFQL